MRLNRIPLVPSSEAEFEKQLNELHRLYEADLENLVDAATYEMEVCRPEERQDLILQYTRDASQLTNDYYMSTRMMWEQYGEVQFPEFTPELYDPYETLYHQVGGFSGTDWNGTNYTQLAEGQSKVGLSVESLWPDCHDIDDWQQLIAEMIERSARDTTQHNRDADPTHPRWARSPRGNRTCAFCAMLASRGFAYTTKESAELGGSFHDGKCKCIPVCSWCENQIFGYGQQHYLDMWNQAKKDAGADADDSEILMSMRRKYYRQLSDGVRPPKKRTSWVKEKSFTNMSEEQSLSPRQWNRRQKALGVPPGIDMLEMHEIVTMERFKKRGQHFVWIPQERESFMPTNDFRWKERDLLVELKGTTKKHPTYTTLSSLIQKAVNKAAKHGVVKDTFLLDLRGAKIAPEVFEKLAGYNLRVPIPIRHLFIMDDSPEGLWEMKLK